MVDKDETYAFSRIRSLEFGRTKMEVSLYPNPVTDVLFVKDLNGNLLKSEDVKEVSIVNTQGMAVYKSTAINSIFTRGIDVRDLGAGIYIVKITSADGTIRTQKVIITK